MIAGLTYNFLPFMILPLYASLERVDARLIEAANDLYASSRTAFRKVTLPITAPGIVAGTLLTFIPAMGDYINAFFLGGPNNKMIGNTIQSLYITQRDYPDRRGALVRADGGIMAIVLIYIKFAGSEALMGEEEAPAMSWLRRNGLMIFAIARGALHAAADRGDHRLLLQRSRRPLQLHLGRVHARALEERVQRSRSSTTRC